MAEQNWKRKEYETWDEAFRGLAPAVRQQSVRVAAYTQVLFVQACADGYGKDSSDGAQEMDGQFADVAYKCGMYHQLGKALVPPEYQLWRSDFTAEEMAVYRKYTSDGRQLIASLQERGLSAKERRTGEAETLETDNIPWRMQRESCQQHMERWDGSGYPEGRQGTDISPIARIVGLAKELDRLSAETKSEEPFGEAFDALCAGSDTLWDPALIEVLRRCRSKCRDVYRKYIHYTMTLPKTIPLVDKRKDRVMGLRYRPMVAARDGKPVLYEAVPWFGGIAGRPGETEDMDALADVLHRTEMTADVSFYLLYEAADDPDVVSIKITLYRLAGSSRIAAALAYAAEHGKQVQCLLELRARFDEQSNIDYSRMLEDAGCDILYGLTQYKVHTKLCLITRRCPGGICYYTQVGTGNYNEKTAEQYTDLMLLTSDPAIGRDAAKTFDRLARGETVGETESLWLAPEGYKPQLMAHIEAQIRLGTAGYIGIKVNAMNDADIMAQLVRASAACTEVELFVRGICCLRPGVPGRTEHISVRSIIGRYLEHERIFVFGRGEAQSVFIGSGDLLERNTVRRIEAFTAVTDPNARAEVLEVLSAMRRDNRQAWIMQPDGSYLRPEPTGEPFVSQTYLHTYFAGRTVQKPAASAPSQPQKKLPWWRRLWNWLKNN